MSLEFRGKALPLKTDGMAEAIDRLGVKAPELWAVLAVETRGCGFLPDRRPLILFERHVFSRETKHLLDGEHSDVSNPKPGGYGNGGAHQYDRLNVAFGLNKEAALNSTSWGIGQVMGFNARNAGYEDVEAMVDAMTVSEDAQLLGMVGEIASNRLDRSLRNHDWSTFARGYNGPKYAENSYDTRLAAANQKYLVGPLPDLAIRETQIYLAYLDYAPGPVDGVMGRFTRAALNAFQAKHKLPIDDTIHDDLLAYLRLEVEKLPA